MEPETEVKEVGAKKESTYSRMWNLDHNLTRKETLLKSLIELNEALEVVNKEIIEIEQYFKTTLYINNLKCKYLMYGLNKILAISSDKVEFIEVDGDF